MSTPFVFDCLYLDFIFLYLFMFLYIMVLYIYTFIQRSCFHYLSLMVEITSLAETQSLSDDPDFIIYV